MSGGYLVIGSDGTGQFYSSAKGARSGTPTAAEDAEYLDKTDLPRSVRRAVDRLPENLEPKRSLTLPTILRGAESITEETCVVSGKRLRALSQGACVLEVVVDGDIYEHEITVR